MKRMLFALLMCAPMAAFSNTNYTMPEPAKKQQVAVQSTIKDWGILIAATPFPKQPSGLVSEVSEGFTSVLI